MPRPKENNKEEIKLAISQHLSLNGPTKWPELMAKWPGTSRATFFRYIKDVRASMESAAVDRGGAELRTMQKRIRTQTRTPAIADKRLKATMPVLPSPAVLLGLGSGAEDMFDFMANIRQLMSDANMMRATSVSIQADGTEKLKNPMLMDRSIARRLEMLETWLKSQDMVWNIEKMQEIFHIIVEEVGKTDMNTQQAILARMRTLNNRRGFTADAKLT